LLIYRIADSPAVTAASRRGGQLSLENWEDIIVYFLYFKSYFCQGSNY